MNFSAMKVATRLGLGFALVIVLGLTVAILGRLELQTIGRELQQLSEQEMVKVELASQLKDNVNEIARSVRNVLLLRDTAEMQKQMQRITNARERNTTVVQSLDKLLQHPENRQLLIKTGELRQRYIQSVDKAAALGLRNEDEAAAKVLFGETRVIMAEYFQTLDSLIALQKRLMAQTTQQAQEQAARTGTLMLVLAFVVLVLGVGTTWLITRSITHALGGEPAYASHIAAEIAAGNLAVNIQTAAGDGHSLLAQMRAMRDALAQVVASVRGSSEAVASASGQIAQGNHDLSARTESQASALQETAASMEQLSSTVRHNADNAQQANTLAQSASQVATQGGAVVAQVVDTMRGISSASQRIADIIGVIDGIAFQTNILALNAAVEAARAGEQGRGFAVVASEVRQLAQRSAEAAKEIKLLIHDSSAQVQQGTQLVDNAGSTMDEVVASIRRVTDIMGEISAASREQSAGVAQVGEAVTQMDQATQQNAALVEEMAAAAGSLSQQARDLVQAVAVFQLAGTTAPHGPQPTAQHSHALGRTTKTRAPQEHRASAAPLGGPAYLALPD